MVFQRPDVICRHPTILPGNRIAFHTTFVVAAHQTIDIELHIIAPLLLFGEKGSIHGLFDSHEPGPDGMNSKVNALMLAIREGRVLQIDGMAASAASVIALAGTHVTMSPTSLMMIHNPFTVAMGDTEEMRKAIQLLDEVKESIINAYQIKTGLSRAKISHLMDSETWMNALKARELGFCDEVLYTGAEDLPENVAGFSFERKSAAACLMNRVIASMPKPQNVVKEEPEHPPEPKPSMEEPIEPEPVTPDNRVKAADLEKRLSLLK